MLLHDRHAYHHIAVAMNLVWARFCGAEFVMRPNPSQSVPDPASEKRVEWGGSSVGWLGLIIFPIAAVFYLIALPFFLVLWLLEFVLPRHPDEIVLDEPAEEPEVQYPRQRRQQYKLGA
jgi:hypothetical protein